MDQFFKIMLLFVAGLFPIVNPLGVAPIFLSMTEGESAQTRNLLARRIAINGMLLLLGSLFIGSYVLDFFGITLPVVKVAGGLVVTYSGWSILNQKAEPREGSKERLASKQNILHCAFYPLTLPLTVGPGSIATTLTLGTQVATHMKMHRADSLLISNGAAVVGIVLIAISIYLCFRFADSLGRLLGESGTTVLVRLSAFILLCIGIQIIWNGASELLTPLLKS
jgi:multiple antibiotic resistance protein